MSPTIEPRPRGRRDAKGLIRSRAAALLTSMLFVGACQSPPSGSDLDLWGALRSGPHGLEVDPPSTVADIASSAEVVLKGRVVGVEPGPTREFPSGDPQTEALIIPSVFLEVEVSEVLAGEAGRNVRVWFSTSPHETVKEAAANLPGGEYLWFLTSRHSVDGALLLVSRMGVIGDERGAFGMPLEPEVGRQLLPEGVDTLDELVDLVEPITGES